MRTYTLSAQSMRKTFPHLTKKERAAVESQIKANLAVESFFGWIIKYDYGSGSTRPFLCVSHKLSPRGELAFVATDEAGQDFDKNPLIISVFDLSRENSVAYIHLKDYA